MRQIVKYYYFESDDTLLVRKYMKENKMKYKDLAEKLCLNKEYLRQCVVGIRKCPVHVVEELKGLGAL